MKTQTIITALFLSVVFLAVPYAQAGAGYGILQATLAKPVKSSGVVRIGMTQWRCRGTQCGTKVRTNINLLNACKSLVRKVGPVRRFGFSSAATKKPKPAANKKPGSITGIARPPAATDRRASLAGAKALMNVMSCNQSAQNTGRDMLTTHLQSEINARSQDVTTGTQMMKNVNDSRAAILRNIR